MAAALRFSSVPFSSSRQYLFSTRRFHFVIEARASDMSDVPAAFQRVLVARAPWLRDLVSKLVSVVDWSDATVIGFAIFTLPIIDSAGITFF